jgi:predicted HAD superfamily Cof-like phosphohydrolase
MGIDSYEAWNKVLRANLAKEVGVKPERPNPLGLPDLIKPAGWKAPSHTNNHGLLTKLEK